MTYRSEGGSIVLVVVFWIRNQCVSLICWRGLFMRVSLSPQTQFQPRHVPDSFWRLWQSNLQVDSAAHNANSLALNVLDEHSHPCFSVQSPVSLPIMWQVPLQKGSPNMHLDGKYLRISLKSTLLSLHLKKGSKIQNFSFSWFAYMHFPPVVQIPEVWPKTTQLMVHIELPVVLTKNQLHRNPAWLNCKIKAKIKHW